ncbi:MAG: polyphosphate kinase 1, partial [Sphaerotilus sp.]|nr:polyphosphate kinase 1 [Sphaerotilus sp.]
MPDTMTSFRAPALISRERSILEFNRRVLAQARRKDVPLLERLRYICIVSSNMDEFFEVRFAAALEAARLTDELDDDEDLARAVVEAHALIDEQYRVFNEEVMPALAAERIVIVNHADRTEAQRQWVSQFFHREVQPLLMPLGLDPAHPFPQVANKSLNFIAQLAGADAFGRENSIAIIKVPRVLPRIIRLPERVAEGRQAFVMLTSVIRAHLAELFPGRQVLAFSQFRVTRDSDLDVDEDDVTNLRQALRSELTTRHYGREIRLEVVNTCPPELAQFLLNQFDLPPAALYRVNGPVNLVRMNTLIDLAVAPKLRFAPHEPTWPAAQLPRSRRVMDCMAERDILLHQP